MTGTARKRRIVHFGPADLWPGRLFPQDHRNLGGLLAGRKIRSDEIHYCIERQGFFRNAFRREWGGGRQVTYAGHDASTTALKGGSVHEVHIHNVFSHLFSRGPLQARLLLAEAKRILRTDGVIYVGNLQTPEAFPLERMRKLAGRLHLGVEILLADTGKSQPLEIDERERGVIREIVGPAYAHDLSLVGRGYYVVALRKVRKDRMTGTPPRIAYPN